MTLKQLDHVLDGMYFDGDTHIRAKDLRRVLAGFCADEPATTTRDMRYVFECGCEWGYHNGRCPDHGAPFVRSYGPKDYGLPKVSPPPPPSPDATEKGGGRAREMAEMLITPFISAPDGKADSRHVSIGMGHDGTLVRPSVRTCDNALAAIRNVLADALRAYGDELLEKAAVKTTETVCSDKDCECDDCEAHRHDAHAIRAMKSSAGERMIHKCLTSWRR